MSTNSKAPGFMAHGLARIVIAFLYWTHGAQKILGWFGGFGNGGTADLTTRFGAAGLIEVIGGALIMVGLFARPAAFIASGEMAVAYFWAHVPRGGLWPWENGGEVVAIYSFFFLFIALAGPGAFALDSLLNRRRSRVGPQGVGAS
ncbi:MAG TPA: DoxX family protein [Longimicrobiales bacterium]|nr:DoxX family protein [Longimicrobiales bacterium]